MKPYFMGYPVSNLMLNHKKRMSKLQDKAEKWGIDLEPIYEEAKTRPQRNIVWMERCVEKIIADKLRVRNEAKQ